MWMSMSVLQSVPFCKVPTADGRGQETCLIWRSLHRGSWQIILSMQPAFVQVPYLKRVAAAHKLHHAEKYGGVPWGLFLGPQELEAVGATGDLDRLCAEQARQEKMGRE